MILRLMLRYAIVSGFFKRSFMYLSVISSWFCSTRVTKELKAISFLLMMFELMVLLHYFIKFNVFFCQFTEQLYFVPVINCNQSIHSVNLFCHLVRISGNKQQRNIHLPGLYNNVGGRQYIVGENNAGSFSIKSGKDHIAPVAACDEELVLLFKNRMPLRLAN